MTGQPRRETGGTGWDPAQYLAFADERGRPARDLLARVPSPAPDTIYDLGCGAGNVTALLAGRWPGARIVGVDSAPAMLARARETLLAAEWVEADLAHWSPPAAADLIFSNAALHWLDDHETLFPRLFAALAPGGVLAVQMPRNFAAPSHRLIVEAASAGPWRDRLAAAVRRYQGDGPVAGPAVYDRLLAREAAAMDIWETEYMHKLTGKDPVLGWLRSTALRPVLDILDPDQQGRFLADLGGRLAAAYPPDAVGSVLFPFRRLFIVATRR